MAWKMGLLGKKIGHTQLFDAKGNKTPVCVLQTGPCVVLDIKTQERDGYSAVQIGFEEMKATRTTKARVGVCKKANTAPCRYVREFRLTAEETAQFQIGQKLSVDQVFSAGDVIDVTGTSKGKGFQGVMKRHHFSGFGRTHGTHEYFRHGGSIGCRLTPGRVHKGKRMGGHMGAERVTVQNMRVVEVIADKNLLLIKGATPGAPDNCLMIRHAAKRPVRPFQMKTAAAPTAETAENQG